MSYLRPSVGNTAIDAETVTLLGRLAGLSIPSEDIEPLATALQSQLASIEILEEMDLDDVNPDDTFDPGW